LEKCQLWKELKNIRGQEIVAIIVVPAPRTVVGLMLIQVNCMVLKINSISLMKVSHQDMFNLVKVITYLRWQQKVK
jgi:hypothetical protein